MITISPSWHIGKASPEQRLKMIDGTVPPDEYIVSVGKDLAYLATFYNSKEARDWAELELEGTDYDVD